MRECTGDLDSASERVNCSYHDDAGFGVCAAGVNAYISANTMYGVENKSLDRKQMKVSVAASKLTGKLRVARCGGMWFNIDPSFTYTHGAIH